MTVLVVLWSVIGIAWVFIGIAHLRQRTVRSQPKMDPRAKARLVYIEPTSDPRHDLPCPATGDGQHGWYWGMRYPWPEGERYPWWKKVSCLFCGANGNAEDLTFPFDRASSLQEAEEAGLL